MDLYFTDRNFNYLGIASTEDSPIQVSADVDDEIAPNSVGRSYTATLNFANSDIHKVKEMAALGNFVLYKDYRERYTFMTIMEWTGFEPWAGTLTFVAENGGIDLINETVGPYTATKAMPIADYINQFTADSGFEIGTNEIANQTRTLKWEGDSDTSLARIESVATQFDAELDFRFDVSGTAVIKRYIDIYKRVGADKGQRLEVNTHLNKITTTGNIYDLYTSVVATGGTPEGSETPITLAGYKWTDPDGRYVLTSTGLLLDTVANQKWSRLGVGGAVANVKGGYINRVITYTATTQAELFQSALAGLKAATEPALNYDVDIVDLPRSVNVGDTVHAVDELQDLNLSTRLLELKTSYADDTRTATLGDFLIEANAIDPQLQEMADTVKTLQAQAHWYPWTRYADDDQGTGISAVPLGKIYMAIVWGKAATPSDDPTDYAGHWQKVTGEDGSIGKPGPPGADGKSQYIHTAYAKSADGVDGFSTTSSADSSYMGNCVDENKFDPTDPSAYTWVRFKGDDAITLTVTSINGNMFKNSGISTVLTVTITYGGNIIDNSSKLSTVMGDDNYLQWQVMNIGETEYSDLSRDDSRLLDKGFMLTVNVDDVHQKATYRCQLCDNN
ncbi:phage tail spike protein [Lacticaseibacillus porcinae]|uniref:phage tail spike protein n=1 Tax=Lacticaseibacillus porcinae TaxID=1123687 RepID=UPI000F76D57C|nr:phage tail spike protein [Lacticaseibacillus porcinae]